MSSCIIPTLKYEKVEAAIEWLCKAFGFEKHLIVSGETGTIDHAQLTLNGGMIMLSSTRNMPFDEVQKTPNALGGVSSQSPYIIIEDVESHFSSFSTSHQIGKFPPRVYI